MTVRELMDQLATYPPDAEVGIEDADTARDLLVTEVRLDRGVVLLSGDYDQEIRRG